MANPLGEIFRPLVRGFGEAASKAKPFYSGVDQAISAITQNKGTGQQMLAEILKTKGAAKELKDRPVVRAALNQPKITKEQLQKIATDNPAPQFTEKTRGESAFEAEVDKRVAEMKRFRVNEIMDEMNPDSLPQSAEQWKAARLSAESVVKDEEKQIRQNVVDVLDDEGNFDTKFEQWTIPGGTNHREILFQLPDNRAAPNAKYDDIAAKARAQSRLMTTEERAERSRLYDEIKRPLNFEDPHYSEPNILAHARVSDRFEPNGDKALHVEEVQSAWHQKARDTRKKEIKRLIDSGVSKAEANKQVPVEYGYQFPEKESRAIKSKIAEIESYGLNATPEQKQEWVDLMNRFQPETQYKKVPDSPFKENWHELVMKRLLDDAVKNGYKKVYITPGAEQAKRYNLAKYISKIEYERQPNGTYHVIAITKNGDSVLGDMYKAEELPNILGKDVSARIFSGDGVASEGNNYKELSGVDLKLGGEGMLGFYDKMVPSFVNDYGAPYNMKMNLHDTPVGGNKYTVFEDSNPSPFSVVREGGSAIASRHNTREEAEAAAAELSTQPLHSITITPEFEKHVQEKGQRLYQAIPAGIGAGIGAEALTEEEPAPMKKGGPVSLDAMRLAVMNKKVQHKQYGGPTFVRSGISRIRKNMNPVKGNTIIKEGGGNWLAGGVERGLKGLKRDETPVLPITEAEVTAMRNAGYTVYDPVTQTYTKPNPTNQFVDKQLTKYVKNQMGTKDDPIRLAADAFPAQKAKLLAEKQVQIDKATADMEKAQQARGFTPEMMTRSQARIRALEKERDLIGRMEGMHFNPFEIQEPSPSKLMQKRMDAGMTAKPLGQTENAKNWENLVDRSIQPSTAREWTEGSLYPEPLASNPWLYKVAPDAKVYTALDLQRGLGFDHMMDELRNATTPTSGLPKELLIDPKNLSKWTMPQAAEHVDKINAWRAAQKAEADVARANNAATVLHKDYPEKGMKWVELRTPEVKLEEGHSLGVPSGYPDMHGVMDTKTGQSVSFGATPEEAMRLYKRQEREGQLADALKYEGEQLQHCVGGYCSDVTSGASRIFSLRDAKGNPYVTVEVKPNRNPYPVSGEAFAKLTPAEKAQYREHVMQWRRRNPDVEELTDEHTAQALKEAGVEPQPPSIAQIKGKGNAAPSEEYLPYVQDFVRSGKWSDVKDLKNTGLIREGDELMTPSEHADWLLKQLNAPPEGMAEGSMKRGGVVHMDKGGTPEEQEARRYGIPETPEQEVQRYLRMFRINASGGRDQYGTDISGKFGINIPVSKNVTIEPYFQGYAYKPNSGKVEHGGTGGAYLNIRFNNGGTVSDDAMRMAVMNKQLRKHHGY